MVINALKEYYGASIGVSVIQVMKRKFARHGIPDECVTDNGPQFVSHEYARFAREYGFTSIKLSPYHSRGNGKAESAVTIAKNILKKSRFEDPCLALLPFETRHNRDTNTHQQRDSCLVNSETSSQQQHASSSHKPHHDKL